MAIVYLCLALYILLFALVYYSSVKPALAKPLSVKKNLMPAVLTLLLAAIVRIVVAVSIEGYGTDISCFKSWSVMAYEGGLQNFYFTDAFTDYPPGYMYVLWLLGAVKSWFGIAYESAAFTLMIKLPAIICDLITGYFIYHILQKRTNNTLAVCLSLLYLINPAVILNSSAWGQVDSVFTLFVVLYIYYICEKKLLPACVFFALGILIKPQTVIFTPVLLLYLYRMLFWEGDWKKALKQIAIAAGVSLGLLFVLILPFAKGFNFMPIVEQYIKTLSSYPHASVNAYNFFALVGGNWKDLDIQFLFLPYGVWSNIFIVGIVAVCVYVYIKQKGKTNLFALAAFIIMAMFTMAAKMHERYVFPALCLLIMAFAYKKDTRYLGVFGLLSAGQLLNTAMTLHQSLQYNTTAAPDGAYMPIVCLINIAAFVYMVYVLFHEKEEAAFMPAPKTKKQQKKTSPAREFNLMASAPKTRLTRVDAAIMAAVTLVYAVVALFNLGDMAAPETKWDSMQIGDGFRVEFAEGTYVQEMEWFTGSYEERAVTLRVGEHTAAGTQVQTYEKNLGSVFCWHKDTIGKTVDYIELETTVYDTAIQEIAFTDTEGNLLTPASVTPLGEDRGTASLMDEQTLVPAEFSYKNSTYFDEIYHARTAYEFLNGLTPYENTHPPLGKVLISLGILLFGMNPFGWRIVGTLFGIAMLPCIYLFAKKLFKSTPVACMAIVLFAADFMHFAQTRIATIDVYITFFIILMYYFMYDYTQKSFYDTPFSKTLVPLGLSGLCMGLGIASKWTGVYAGIGLAVLFFISLGRRIYEYKKVMGNPRATKEQRDAVAPCKKYCTYTILWCLVFFVAVPALIYVLSYIPYLRAPGMEGFKSIWDNQTSMFSYHSRLTDSHPFASPWYEWPVIARPIWYYSGETAGAARMSIASFGNPFIWWLGIGAFVYCIYKLFKDKSYSALFLVIGYLSQYLPWVGVTRVVFIYHYFTCVPFLVLMLCYVARDALSRSKTTFYTYRGLTVKHNATAALLCVYVLICVLAFCSFYPVLSGMEVSASYIDGLKWFDSWVF